ncbi:Nucleoside ABC transporter, permease protein 2 [Actinomycetales bacterium JB111]|nr:Nucleoside ABC transporter, permease protein 2 [Actinomycetales bacterium JB111]
MSAATVDAQALPDMGPVKLEVRNDLAKRSWRWPIVHAVLALVVLGWFLTHMAEGSTTFQFSSRGDILQVPNLTVPGWTGTLVLGLVIAAVAVVAGAFVQLRRPVPVYLHAISIFALVIAFLTWVGAGLPTIIPLTELVAGGLALSVPLVFGAMSGVLCERSGIVNIAIEGQLLCGAFLAAVVASTTASAYVGMAAAPIAGALVGALLVLFAVKYHVDQIIVGVVLNVLALGVTGFLFSTVLSGDGTHLNRAMRLPDLPIPGLSNIPVIGNVLFDQSILVYLMYVGVIVLQIYLFRSRWGLRIRSVGEHPKAADTVGIDVIRTRVWTTILGGAVAGLGGAFLTVGSGLAFGKDMSAGQGYIALAAMILGRWNPVGAVGAALMFGFAKNLGNTLSTINAPVPSDILLMLPYAVTIVAVAGLVGRVRPPAAENTPYIKS